MDLRGAPTRFLETPKEFTAKGLAILKWEKANACFDKSVSATTKRMFTILKLFSNEDEEFSRCSVDNPKFIFVRRDDGYVPRTARTEQEQKDGNPPFL